MATEQEGASNKKMAKADTTTEDMVKETAVFQRPVERSVPVAGLSLLRQVTRERLGQRVPDVSRPDWHTIVRRRMLIAVELLIITVWTLIVARPYLNLDPAMVPTGPEYLGAIQTHHIWMQARECGWCALWYGSVAGGFPAFAEPTGSALHPLVILTTLGWGVLNGSKLALVGSLLIAGMAQLWLGRVLGLGRIARIWSAGIAVVGGHLAARMQLGSLALVLSTASCALVLPPLIALSRTGDRRTAVLLGVMLALVVVAGNGYLQVGLAFSLLAALLLVPLERTRATLLARRYALAAGLALLLAAPFLVPFLHFLPWFAKDHDPAFQSAQPFSYVPLNLVISDMTFYTADVLHKLPYPSHNANYVGWIPVLLALWALRRSRNQDQRQAIAFLVVFALLALWVASAVPLAWLVRIIRIPQFVGFISGVRYTAFMAGLAVPAILGLAAIGLDRLIAPGARRLRMSLASSGPNTFTVSVDLRWLLAIPLVLALVSTHAFSKQFLGTVRLDAHVPLLLEALRTPDLQWVNVPFGQHFYVESATRMNLKRAYNSYFTWHWKDRAQPEPFLEATQGGAPPGMFMKSSAGGVAIYTAPPGREYATVTHRDGNRTICTAQGFGGNIDVTCATSRPGVLTVKENNWSGWQAEFDGRRLQLAPGQWLSVQLPAGNHMVRFRYWPWDVPLGLWLSLAGVALALYNWYKRDEGESIKSKPILSRAEANGTTEAGICIEASEIRLPSLS